MRHRPSRGGRFSSESRLLAACGFGMLCVALVAVLAGGGEAVAKKQQRRATVTAPSPTPPRPAPPPESSVPPPSNVTAEGNSAAPAPHPPGVAILWPGDGDEVSAAEIEVKLSVRLPEGSTLLSLRALVDGRLAAQARGIALTSTQPPIQGPATHTLKVPLPARDSVLSILAEASPTRIPLTSVRLRWKGSAQADMEVLQPRLYLLSVGVSEYRQTELRLRFAAKDAADTAATFRAQAKALYRSVEVKLLSDSQATKSNILDGLEWLQRQTTARDIAVLFLAGHGVTDPGTGGYYFLPHDADMAAMKRTMIPESEIRETLSAIAGKVILFLDSCHSGKVFAANQAQTRGPADLSGLIGQLASAESGVVVFAASTGRQSSQEALTWNNGAFTKALLEGLNGRADYKKLGHITINMLDLYISDRVKELTEGRQTPTTAKPSTIPDFPIAIVRDLRNEDIELAH